MESLIPHNGSRARGPYVIYQGGKADVGVMTDSPVDPFGGAVATYTVAPRKACSIVGISACLSNDPSGDTDSTITIDVRISGVKTAQLIRTGATDAGPTVWQIDWTPGTYPVALTDYIDVLLTTADDLGSTAELVISVWAQDD